LVVRVAVVHRVLPLRALIAEENLAWKPGSPRLLGGGGEKEKAGGARGARREVLSTQELELFVVIWHSSP